MQVCSNIPVPLRLEALQALLCEPSYSVAPKQAGLMIVATGQDRPEILRWMRIESRVRTGGLTAREERHFPR